MTEVQAARRAGRVAEGVAGLPRRQSAPPFFIIHGDRDTLAPVKDARRFAATLRAQTTSPVVYAEIPGAQHAFEIFPSARATFVVHGVERFLSLLYSDYLVARRGQAAAS